MTAVAAPGVYELPEDVYLADPVPSGSLSASGAKALLPPSCPARFRYDQLHGRPPKPAFDFGHAVHSKVLGVGQPIVVVDAEDWRSKAAREQRDEAYAAGHVPLLAADDKAATAAADAVRSYRLDGRPLGDTLFAAGEPERSLFWLDDEHPDVMRRARVDWLRPREVVDLKTCVSAEPGAIARTVASFGYTQQADWYLDGVQALGLADDPAFLFVFVEKTPPYLVTVCQLDAPALEHGRRRNRQALRTYRECRENDYWPSYADGDIPVISLPAWALREDAA